MKVAIFGYGNVGKQIAELMANVGQDVVIACPSHKTLACKYETMSFEQAAIEAEAIIIAVHYSVVHEVFVNLKEHVVGKIVVDATNPLNDDWSPLLLGQENSAGEEVQRLLPDSYVVKAFNTIFADVMGQEQRAELNLPLTAFVASNHREAKTWLMNVMTQAKFTAIDVGNITSARYLEAMAHLNIEIAVAQEGGTSAGFIYSKV